MGLVCPSKSNPGQYEQAGIVAWGLGCGSETPGVYADVTKALRFIDWATKCVEGSDADYYGFGFDGRWAKHEYCGYKDKIFDNEQDMKDFKSRISTAESSSERKSIRKNIRAITSCQTGKKDFDCNIYDYEFDDDEEREVDLSGHARDSATVKPRLGDVAKE